MTAPRPDIASAGVPVAALAGALALLLGSPGAAANPHGAQVVHGQVSIDASNPAHLRIHNSPNAIINWQAFGIAPGEVTQFLQANSQSAVLNRVVGQLPSEILGQLLSNGRVFLVNPNGIVFGPNAVVDTAGLVASTLDIANADFVAGNYRFKGGGGAAGIALEEHALVKATGDGSVLLLAPNIENHGVIETDGGDIVLAAGHELVLTSLDSPEIAFEVQAPENEVVNLGDLLTRGGAASIFAGTIEQGGAVNANAVTRDAAGNVVLFAQADVNVTAEAAITASGPKAGTIEIDSATGDTWVAGTVEADAAEGVGGRVKITGERIAVYEEAEVSADGRDGGGIINVGGGFQGKDPDIRNAVATFVGRETRITANAETSGDGGEVVVWADEATRAYGVIEAKGGASGGDGGEVEVSGKRFLEFDAMVDTSAPAGDMGNLLLDPLTITVFNGMGQPQDGLLPIFLTGAAAGNSSVSEMALEGQTTSIVLQADNGITINDLADDVLDLASINPGEDIQLEVLINGDIVFNDPNDEIRTAGGDIGLVVVGTGNIVAGKLNTGGTAGQVDLFTQGGGDITTNGTIDAHDGVSITATNGDLTVNDTITSQDDVSFQTTGTGDINLNGAVTSPTLLDFDTASGTIDINAVTGTTGDVDFETGGGDIVVRQAYSADGDVDFETGFGGKVDIQANLTSTGGDVDLSGSTAVDGNGSAIVSAGGDVNISSDAGIGLGGFLVTDTTGVLNLNTFGIGAAGNIRVHEISAGLFNTSEINLTTDSTSIQDVELCFDNGLNVDGNLGFSFDDRFIIKTTGGTTPRINGGAGALRATEIVIEAEDGIGASGPALNTETGMLTASNTVSGRIAIDNTGDVQINGLSTPTAGDVLINETGGSGQVFINGAVNSLGGVTRITANSDLDVSGNITSVGLIDLDAGVTGDVIIGNGVVVRATGVGSVVQVQAPGGNVVNGGTVRSDQASVDIDANGDIQLGRAVASGNVAATAGGQITDGNGSANNITAAAAVLQASGNIGTVADPLETQLPTGTLSLIQPGGNQIGISNTGGLLANTTLFTIGGGTDAFLESSGDLVFGDFEGVDSFASLTAHAGGSIVANSADVEASGNINLVAQQILLNSVIGAAGASRFAAQGALTASARQILLTGGTAFAELAELGGVSGGVTINLAAPVGTTPLLSLTAGSDANTYAVIFSSSGPVNITAGDASNPGTVEFFSNVSSSMDAFAISENDAASVSAGPAPTATCSRARSSVRSPSTATRRRVSPATL